MERGEILTLLLARVKTARHTKENERRLGRRIFRSCAQMNINQLLFIKAYALDALEIRTVTKVWENPNMDYASASSLEKELELLLFDM
ncbi:MAG: hypothetical protein IJB91_05655 [Oscillospiraceae bacterium]|nr:hypothetical protein [Oscillospiraceae bacterium]